MIAFVHICMGKGSISTHWGRKNVNLTLWMLVFTALLPWQQLGHEYCKGSREAFHLPASRGKHYFWLTPSHHLIHLKLLFAGEDRVQKPWGIFVAKVSVPDEHLCVLSRNLWMKPKTNTPVCIRVFEVKQYAGSHADQFWIREFWHCHYETTSEGRFDKRCGTCNSCQVSGCCATHSLQANRQSWEQLNACRHQLSNCVFFWQTPALLTEGETPYARCPRTTHSSSGFFLGLPTSCDSNAHETAWRAEGLVVSRQYVQLTFQHCCEAIVLTSFESK